MTDSISSDSGSASERTGRERKFRTAWAAASVALFLLAWEIAAHAVSKPLVLPSIEITLREFYFIVSAPDFLPIVGATLLRIIISFSMAFSVALVLGIPAGIWKPVQLLLSAPMKVMGSVPTMGIILLSIIWLDSEGAPYLVCALVVLPLLYGGISSSIRAIDSKLLEMHKVFAVPPMRKLFKFYLPATLPSFRGTMAAALGLNVKVMIAAEVLSQPRTAIGTAFQIARAQLNTAAVFAWCLVVIIIAALVDVILHRALVFPDRSRTTRVSREDIE